MRAVGTFEILKLFPVHVARPAGDGLEREFQVR